MNPNAILETLDDGPVIIGHAGPGAEALVVSESDLDAMFCRSAMSDRISRWSRDAAFFLSTRIGRMVEGDALRVSYRDGRLCVEPGVLSWNE